MNEKQMTDLVQAGIDGELDATGQAELERLLASSAQARQLHTELAAVAEWLDRAEPVEPPGDLHARIMKGIDLPAPRRSWFSFGSRASASPLGYGLAAVAGAVLTFAVLTAQDIPNDPRNQQDMVGTLAPAGSVEVIGLQRFDSADGEGELRMLKTREGYRLDLLVEGNRSLQWQVEWTLSEDGSEVHRGVLATPQD